MGPGAQRSALSKTGEREAVNLANFFAELKRRNVYRAAAAYGAMSWLLIQITTQVFPFFEIPNSTVRFVVVALIVGFPIAMLVAWLYQLTPEGFVREEEVDPATRKGLGRKMDFVIIGVLLLVIAIAVIYMVLGILYESFIHPLTILSALPFAGFGALLTLMIFRVDLSIYAFVGIILLVGLVKKNGIMMVDFAISAERDEHLSPEQSIRKAALLRFRPIMMTTMAAMLGGVPLMLGTGTGSEIRQPLGYAMVGGLIVSQALTLFTTPVVYLYLDNLSNALSRWARADKPDRSGLAAQHDAQKHAAE
jgi:hypothetical protein